GNKVVLNGTDEWGSILSNSDFEKQYWAISLWFQSTDGYDSGDTVTQCFINKDGSGTNANDFYLGLLGNDGRIIFAHTLDNYSLLSDASSWTAGQWYHVLVHLASTGGEMWIDGVKQADTQADVDSMNNSINIGIGGSYSGGVPFKGSLDEFVIWATDSTGDILSDNDIADLYNSGTGLYVDPSDTFPTDGGSMGTSMATLWHFDESSGTTANDSSGNANHLTMNNLDNEDWQSGKIMTPGTDVAINVWQSQDGVNGLEKGIQTYGDSDGRSILDGRTIRFNILGVEEAQIDVSGDWDLSDNDLTTTGSISGGTITDGTASLSGGNLTSMGNITGSDVDLSLGTGDITTSGNTDLTGGNIRGLRTETTDHTALATDYTILADASAGSVTITLPASPNQGQVFNIKCIGLGSGLTCTIARNGKNIDGSASDVTLSLNESKTLQYDSSFGWAILQ
ncbi:MAG: LamG-like jellyroll fold domain-containing protein, partial [Promethearchaeota archaeon]